MAAGTALAWGKRTTGNFGDLVITTIITNSTTAANTFTPVIGFADYSNKAVRKITIFVEATTLTGTNLDFSLYGSDTEDGAVKYLLLDAPVADLTTGVAGVGIVDLNLYPAPFYFIGVLPDTDESAASHRTILRVFIPKEQP
mgnify:CR=1 FL=1